MNLGAITNIVTHPNDANTAYVLFSYSGWPKVFRTTDLGQSWEDISGFNYIDGDGNLQYGSKNSNNGFPNVITSYSIHYTKLYESLNHYMELLR